MNWAEFVNEITSLLFRPILIDLFQATKSLSNHLSTSFLSFISEVDRAEYKNEKNIRLNIELIGKVKQQTWIKMHYTTLDIHIWYNESIRKMVTTFSLHQKE